MITNYGETGEITHYGETGEITHYGETGEMCTRAENKNDVVLGLSS